MLGRLLITLGSVGASVGLVLVGMGLSYVEKNSTMVNGSIALMIVGVIATVIGAFMYHAEQHSA